MAKRQYLTAFKIKKLKKLYNIGYSHYKISKEFKIGIFLARKWINIIGLKKVKKVNICSWCGKKGKGRSIRKLHLCKTCDSHRCKRCEILLDNNRICEKCGKKHGEYDEKTNLCYDCIDILMKKSYPQAMDVDKKT